MAFTTITIGANTFSSVGRGVYNKSTMTFDGPVDLVKLSPGKVSQQSFRNLAGGTVSAKRTTTSVSRQIEKDITVGSVVSRRKASVTLTIEIPEGFTVAEIDTMVSDLNTWIDSTTLPRLLMGEN